MNEEAFVAFLRRSFPFSHGVGIGDDASVVRVGGKFQLITTDLLVEGVHFRLEDLTPSELARKALAVNLSDIAAMGGTPLYFYLDLAFSDQWHGGERQRFFSALSAACRKWEVELAGGDYSRSKETMIAITVVGTAVRPVMRSGARPGDWIGITGAVGESALGLQLVLLGEKKGYFVRRHRTVVPELAAGRRMASYVNAMIDVSDGLIKDLQRVLDASGCGAEVEVDNIPLSRRMADECAVRGWNPLDLQLGGGEDYVLLFCVSPEKEKRLRKTGQSYSLIGRVRKERRLVLTRHGKVVRLPHRGYDHFSSGRNE